MVHHALALAIGYAVDLVVGDPETLPHPVRLIGRLIGFLEKPLRSVFPKTPAGERAAGSVLVVAVCAITVGATLGVLALCALVSVWLVVAAESVLCAQMLATKSLRTESMKVYEALQNGTIEDARAAVSMIVGRDTASLSAEEVSKAAVETVAENTSDGVAAPMLFMALFGAPGIVFYKAVNTMDSMVGYRNDRYRYFGSAAARFDDVLNFIPARLAGVAMALSAAFVGLDARGALRIFKRDRRNHLSPNSAHTEAACAGALGVQLGGTHTYFGKPVAKPTIGDALRAVEPQDIVRANRLMYATSAVCFAFCLALSCMLYAWGL